MIQLWWVLSVDGLPKKSSTLFLLLKDFFNILFSIDANLFVKLTMPKNIEIVKFVTKIQNKVLIPDLFIFTIAITSSSSVYLILVWCMRHNLFRGCFMPCLHPLWLLVDPTGSLRSSPPPLPLPPPRVEVAKSNKGRVMPLCKRY